MVPLGRISPARGCGLGSLNRRRAQRDFTALWGPGRSAGQERDSALVNPGSAVSSWDFLRKVTKVFGIFLMKVEQENINLKGFQCK